MPQPFTLKHGPWAPDLQNVAVQIQAQYGATEVPSADVNNVYYQDGSYRCLPAPAAIGPAAPFPLLNAFTFYDDVANQEVVFAGTADNGVYALIDGAWVPVTVNIPHTVQGTGVSARFSLASTITGASLAITSSVNSGTAQGQLYNGILGVALINPVDAEYGFVAGSGGSLTPPQDFAIVPGTIAAIHTFGSGINWFLQLEYAAANVPQAYFSSLAIFTTMGALIVRLFSDAASYIADSDSGTTIWNWSFGSNPGIFMLGGSHPITLSY